MTSVTRSHGHYFGYPVCCIQAFHRMLRRNIKFTEISPERQQASKQGFVPCQTCAEKIMKGVIKTEECILPSRKCPKPFIPFS